MEKNGNEIEILARGVCVVDGQLLVCHSRNKWNTYLPGGHVEFGEYSPVALARELVEELGVQPVVGRFLGVAEHRYRRAGRTQCEINLVFAVELPGLDPSGKPAACEDSLDFRWVPLERLNEVELEPAQLCDTLPGWLAQDGAGWICTGGGDQ